MNRMIRSRLSCLAVVLLIPVVLCGCEEVIVGLCGLICSPFPIFAPGPGTVFFLFCVMDCLGIVQATEDSQMCLENPDECAATYEQLQLAAIDFCEEYPEECQQAFDAWVKSPDTEASQ